MARLKYAPFDGARNKASCTSAGTPKVLVNGPIAKFQLKKFTTGVISDGSERGGFDGVRLHADHLRFSSCGFRFRFRSPSAAAICFQRAITQSTPTVGAIASTTRWKANWNSRHRLRRGGLFGQVVAPGGNSAAHAHKLLRQQRHQQLSVQPSPAALVIL